MSQLTNFIPECPAGTRIQATCSCPKEDCPRHGICCACVPYHRNRTGDPLPKRLPACLRDLLTEAGKG